MTVRTAPAPTSASAGTLASQPAMCATSATAAPALPPRAKDGASSPPVAPAPSVAAVSSGLSTITPHRARSAVLVVGESSAASSASLPLPGRTGSHSEAVPVRVPAVAMPAGSAQVFGTRCTLNQSHSRRAPAPSAISAGAAARAVRIVAVVGPPIATSKVGRPWECSHETTVAITLTGRARRTPRRRVPATMVISTAKAVPPRGTLYMAASPAPAAEATSNVVVPASRSSHRASRAATAPAMRRGAPSRPTELPAPTTSTCSTPSAKGRTSPIRRAVVPEPSATAASTPATPPVPRSHHHAAPARVPPAAGASTRRHAGAAPTRSGSAPSATP